MKSCDFSQGVAIVDDDKMPGSFIPRRRSAHGSLQKFLEAEDQVRGKRRAFYMNSGQIGGILFEIIETEKKR